MKSQYSFEKKKGYLLLTITGEYVKEDILTYPKIILDECEKEKATKVLMDLLQLKGTNAPTMDRFFLGEKIAAVLGPKIKLAGLVTKEHINKFVENVAVNRGGLVYATDSYEDAERWLLKES